MSQSLYFKFKATCQLLSTGPLGVRQNTLQIHGLSVVLDRGGFKRGSWEGLTGLHSRYLPVRPAWSFPPVGHLANSFHSWTHHRCHFLLGDFADLQHEKGDSSVLRAPAYPFLGSLLF